MGSWGSRGRVDQVGDSLAPSRQTYFRDTILALNRKPSVARAELFGAGRDSRTELIHSDENDRAISTTAQKDYANRTGSSNRRAQCCRRGERLG
jgi:hypothetical protein